MVPGRKGAAALKEMGNQYLPYIAKAASRGKSGIAPLAGEEMERNEIRLDPCHHLPGPSVNTLTTT
jgi:hypothetical protein